MNDFEKRIHEALDDRGITLPNWRIKIVKREIIGNSDFANVYTEIYPPRKRKPTIVWILAVNFVRNQIFWDHSSFYRP